jgi:hypothetical protein
MLSVQTGQLTEGGLSPPKIGSLVGCSPLDGSADPVWTLSVHRARDAMQIVESWESDARRETARAPGSYVMKLSLSQRFRVFQRTLAVDDRLRFVNRCIQRPGFVTIPFFLDALNGDLQGLLCIKFARDKHETVESEYPQVIAPDARLRKRSNQVLKSVVRVLSVGHVSLHHHLRGFAA